MMPIRLGSIILGLLIGYTVINNFEMSSFLMQKAHEYSWAHLLIALFFALNILSVIGLLLGKIWGFYLAYASIIFSTVFFSTNYIPFITHLFDPKFHTHLLLYSNGAFLLVLALCHLMLKLKRQ